MEQQTLSIDLLFLLNFQLALEVLSFGIYVYL